MILATIRTAFGDIQPPAYDYWSNRYAGNTKVKPDKVVSQSYIAIIWVFWTLYVYVGVILLLNFLIAIVSESYNYILDNQVTTMMQGRWDLND